MVKAGLPVTDPQFGKAHPCPDCHNFLATSGLTAAEQLLSLGDVEDQLDDRGRNDIVRYVWGHKLQDPTGFFTICGPNGTGKSYLLKVLAAEACRKGIHARYYDVRDLADRLARDWNGETDYAGLFRRIPLLIIDELDKANWYNKSGEVSAIGTAIASLINDRYRKHDELATTFAMERPPDSWDCPTDVESRLRDRRFAQVWTAQTDSPYLLKVYEDLCAPGFLEIDTNSIDARLLSPARTADGIYISPATGRVEDEELEGVWHIGDLDLD